jgi:hypothetical protein
MESIRAGSSGPVYVQSKEAAQKAEQVARQAEDAAKQAAVSLAEARADLRRAETVLEKKDAKGGGENTIRYEVLKQKNVGNARLWMDILVDEAASKAEVMILAKDIERQYAGKTKSWVICIYDSRVAWQRQLDESYPEQELLRHHLVVIDDLGPIRWIGEGRGH